MPALTSVLRTAALGALLACSTVLAAQNPVPAAPYREQGTLIFDGIPEADARDAEALGRYLESRQAGLVGWLADGSLLISTRFADVEQLHRVRTPLGMREQLTYAHEPLRVAAGSPTDADTIVYTQDRNGDENAQLYLKHLADGSTRLLTDGKSLYGPPVWSNDGKRIAFYSNARNGADYDIYVVDTESPAPPRLVVGGGKRAFYVQDWSFDDSKLLLVSYASVSDSTLFIADLATGKLTQVEPEPKSKEPVSVTAARFSRDGRGIYLVSTHGGEFAELRYTDIYTQMSRSIAPQSHWDIDALDVGRNGHYLAYTLNEAGLTRGVVHDLKTQADLLLPPLPPGAIVTSLAFDPDGDRLACAVETAQAPRDIYVYELGAAAPQLVRWTHSELGPVDPARLVPAQSFSYPTWDRAGAELRQIPAFLYKPATPGPHPVIIDIHGGPESQYRPGWNSFTQYLVAELGFAVVAPNVRGSSGYGQTYLTLDDGRLREDAVRDIGSLLVWIGQQGDLDRSRVIVMGGSYGGYMTLASLVKYSDRLAGGIDTVGISNFVTFLEKTSPYRRDLRRAEYGDERDPATREFLQKISPLTNAASIRRPLLIVQGLADPRVPASESQQMLARLRGNGGEVWYLAAKDEGHGFRKKGNRDAYLETIAQFLRHLAAPAPTPLP